MRESTATGDVSSPCSLTGSDLGPLLQGFAVSLSKAHFDEAREQLESFRAKSVPLSATTEHSLCQSLLSACSQLTRAESTYYSLNFMIPKALFRRESTLLLDYTHIKAELCRLDKMIENIQDSTAEDIRRRLIDFISARISMINVYNSFTAENFGHPSELTSLAAVVSSVEDLLKPLIHHHLFLSLFTVIVDEVVVMKLLIETQLALLRCEFLPSLINLKKAHSKLYMWFNSLEYNRIYSKTTNRFFRFGSQAHSSALRLCEWTDEFYLLLLAKFSLYFYDVLQPHCPPADFDHTVDNIKPNFIHTFFAFYRKMEPLFILLVINRCDAPDIPFVIGYGCSSELGDGDGELRKKFLIMLKIGGEMKELRVLLPSVSILIQGASAKRSGTECITYCYDQLMSRSFFVLPVEYNLHAVVIFGKKVGERDSTVVNFLLNSCSHLRCAKLCQSLRRTPK